MNWAQNKTYFYLSRSRTLNLWRSIDCPIIHGYVLSGEVSRRHIHHHYYYSDKMKTISILCHCIGMTKWIFILPMEKSHSWWLVNLGKKFQQLFSEHGVSKIVFAVWWAVVQADKMWSVVLKIIWCLIYFRRWVIAKLLLWLKCYGPSYFPIWHQLIRNEVAINLKKRSKVK